MHFKKSVSKIPILEMLSKWSAQRFTHKDIHDIIFTLAKIQKHKIHRWVK